MFEENPESVPTSRSKNQGHPTQRAIDSAPILALALLVIALGLSTLVGRGQVHQAVALPQKEAEPQIDRAARALREGGRIDLNTASQAELELLPRVGPAIAMRIIEARPFRSTGELLRVRGVGERTLERLSPLVSVCPNGSGACAEASP